jgi:hypothetical protein
MARTLRNEAVDRPTVDQQRSSDAEGSGERRTRKAAKSGGGTREDGAPADEARGRQGGSGDGRAVVTLSPAVATATRRMSEQMGGVGTTEVVRRGLILLDLLLNLEEGEELVVRDARTKQVDRLRFAWDTF